MDKKTELFITHRINIHFILLFLSTITVQKLNNYWNWQLSVIQRTDQGVISDLQRT